MADKPLWRRTFDSVDQRVAQPIEDAERSDAFGDVLTITLRLRARAQREVEQRTRRARHPVNLPAATDVRRLSEQVAALRRELRELEDAVPPSRGTKRPVSGVPGVAPETEPGPPFRGTKRPVSGVPGVAPETEPGAPTRGTKRP